MAFLDAHHRCTVDGTLVNGTTVASGQVKLGRPTGRRNSAESSEATKSRPARRRREAGAASRVGALQASVDELSASEPAVGAGGAGAGVGAGAAVEGGTDAARLAAEVERLTAELARRDQMWRDESARLTAELERTKANSVLKQSKLREQTRLAEQTLRSSSLNSPQAEQARRSSSLNLSSSSPLRADLSSSPRGDQASAEIERLAAELAAERTARVEAEARAVSAAQMLAQQLAQAQALTQQLTQAAHVHACIGCVYGGDIGHADAGARSLLQPLPSFYLPYLPSPPPSYALRPCHPTYVLAPKLTLAYQ